MKKSFHKSQPTGPSVDVILKILELAHAKKPEAVFISSLLMQYRERGGLSKKQLEGLLSKAGKIEGIPPQHLATLDAIILKKHSREKSPVSIPIPLANGEDESPLIEEILSRFPAHKRVLLFQAKLAGRQTLTTTEKEELKKFHKLLIK
jgi:hypothetical protein